MRVCNGWTKYFLDSQIEDGQDYDVANKTASWSRGRLDNMMAVDLSHDSLYISIAGLGDFWQSDDYEVCIGDSWPSITTRRLQKQLKLGDIFIRATHDNNRELVLAVGNIKELASSYDNNIYMLTNNDIHQWLTVEMNLMTKKTRYYLAEHKI